MQYTSCVACGVACARRRRRGTSGEVAARCGARAVHLACSPWLAVRLLCRGLRVVLWPPGHSRSVPEAAWSVLAVGRRAVVAHVSCDAGAGACARAIDVSVAPDDTRPEWRLALCGYRRRDLRIPPVWASSRLPACVVTSCAVKNVFTARQVSDTMD